MEKKTKIQEVELTKPKYYFFRKTKKTDKMKKLKKSQINNLGKGKYKNTAEIKQRVLQTTVFPELLKYVKWSNY